MGRSLWRFLGLYLGEEGTPALAALLTPPCWPPFGDGCLAGEAWLAGWGYPLPVISLLVVPIAIRTVPSSVIMFWGCLTPGR